MKNTTLIYTAFTKESIVILLFLLCINSFYAQVKIGENPQVIDPTSLLELESNSRTLVLSRVSTNEMQAILPLRGALLYNTDAQCIFYFNGTTWVNLCQGGSNFSITDNGDNTYTVNDGINPEFTFSTNSETITL